MKEREKESIAIVGAGLVGSMLALFLARRGFSVEVYERRADMRRQRVEAGRSINLAISTRGLHALGTLGLESSVLARAIPMRGRMVHSVKGELSFQPYGKDESQFINSISRGELNEFLMSRAEESGKVRFHFEQRLVGADFESGRLYFQSSGRQSGDEGRAEVNANVVFGTDGAYSAVRRQLVEQGACESREDALDYGYKELILPAAPGNGFHLEKNALHIWPRGTYMLIALPNFDGSFTCTLFLPFEGPLSFASLGDAPAVEAFFRSQFADVRPLLPNLIEDFFGNPTGHMVTVRCAPWHLGGHALLMGDAAHAIVPFFGQGMNAGFEDCTALDELLARGDSSWEKLFEDFTRDRKPNADAIADMALENFIEMRDSVAHPRFLLQKEVEKWLQRQFPDDYVSRYQMVTFSRIPYRRAYELGLKESEILQRLTQGKSSLADVDQAEAIRLVTRDLLPLMKDVARTSGGA